jgi:hypothetical protein
MPVPESRAPVLQGKPSRSMPGERERTRLMHGTRRTMTYKLDGAKFPSLDELVEALYPVYADRMSIEEFRAYAEANAEKS